MKLIFTLLLLLFTASISAQTTILFEQDAVVEINQNIDISDNAKDFPLDLYFKNNTNGAISVNWRREFGENCPFAWDIAPVDQNVAYIPSVNQSTMPIQMAPADSHFLIRQIFWPRMVAGCCDVRVIFSLEGSPGTDIDTGYYHIEINPDTCSIATSLDDDFAKLTFYPNPVQNSLTIENGENLASLQILDAKGKICLQGLNPSSDQVDLSTLSTGVYFLKVKGKSGGILIRKLVKM